MQDSRMRNAYDEIRLAPESSARIRAALERELSSGEEKEPVKTATKTIHILLIAAILAVLAAGSAFALGLPHSTGSHYMRDQGVYRSLKDLPEVEKIVGYPVTAVEEFSNGLRFESLYVGGEAVYDEDFNVLQEYYGVMAEYRSDDGKRITLSLTPVLDILGGHEAPAPSETRDLDGVELRLSFDRYRFVPPDYEKTEEDLRREAAGHFYISYGADAVEEHDYAFADFVLDGVNYVLMDSDASPASGDTLTQMAAELLAAHRG